MSVIGVPVKVLHEAEGHIVTVETTSGEVYRGKLIEAEDNMNSQVLQLIPEFTLRGVVTCHASWVSSCLLFGLGRVGTIPGQLVN
jgi:hypothetical protein